MYRSGYLHYPRNISGLEESDSGVWKLFLAIAIHGSAIAFCIGTEMVTTGDFVKKLIIFYNETHDVDAIVMRIPPTLVKKG